MKRITLLLMTALLAAACTKVTPETQIRRISDYFASAEDVHSARLNQYAGEKKADYLTLVLGKDLKAADIWTLEHEDGSTGALVAEFPGRKNERAELTLISAPLDDPTACATVLAVMEAFRECKIRPKNTIRALFYDPAQDSSGRSILSDVAEEMRESSEFYEFNLVLTSRDSIPARTFILEEKPVFAKKMLEVIPPYFTQLGDYRFEQGSYPAAGWPMSGSTYRYGIEAGTTREDAAAVTAFSYLLNF